MKKLKRFVGKVYEITVDELVSNSIEDLIDKGVRFTVINEEEDGEEDNDTDGY